jgi:hypothetical protein
MCRDGPDFRCLTRLVDSPGAEAAHEVDRREVSRGSGADGSALVVAGQAAVEHQPAEGRRNPNFGPASRRYCFH